MNFRALAGVVACALIAGGASAQSTKAVEWKRSDGGNGHWYEFSGTPVSWPTADGLANAKGAHLFTPNTPPENDFALLPAIDFGAQTVAVGVRYYGATGGPICVTGEPFPNLYGRYSSSCSYYSPEIYAPFFAFKYVGTQSVSLECVPLNANMPYVLEWDADCNGDGVVDFGQIVRGELVDTNADWIPDCCQAGGCGPTSPSLILNGGFESGTPLAACSGEQAVAGTTLCQGWSVGAGVVSRFHSGTNCRTQGRALLEDYCVDLCGAPNSPGSIRQAIPAVPGRKYRISFWLSGDCRCGTSQKGVRVTVSDRLSMMFNFQCTGSGAQGWNKAQFEFTAQMASELLEIAAIGEVTDCGPLVDGIRMDDVTVGCVGDIDGSGAVDGGDIALLLLNFGECSN